MVTQWWHTHMRTHSVHTQRHAHTHTHGERERERERERDPGCTGPPETHSSGAAAASLTPLSKTSSTFLRSASTLRIWPSTLRGRAGAQHSSGCTSDDAVSTRIIRTMIGGRSHRSNRRPVVARVRVEAMGSQTCRIVGKSQPALLLINPMISTRTRTRCLHRYSTPLLGCRC
eukprot:COSAG01_NODE_4451_length_5007_cov_5.064181_3_plen_173_part_00